MKNTFAGDDVSSIDVLVPPCEGIVKDCLIATDVKDSTGVTRRTRTLGIRGEGSAGRRIVRRFACVDCRTSGNVVPEIQHHQSIGLVLPAAGTPIRRRRSGTRERTPWEERAFDGSRISGRWVT